MDSSVTRNTLPRPVSGDGEILITSGEGDVVLVWKKGQIEQAHLASDANVLMDAQTLEPETSGISSCECCKRTDGGVRVCHAIPCGSVCE